MNTDREQWHDALRECPALPDDMYAVVERSIVRRRTVRSVLCSVAAGAALAFCGWFALEQRTPVVSHAAVAGDIVDDELVRLGSFVNAAGMDEELLSFVVPGDLE